LGAEFSTTELSKTGSLCAFPCAICLCRTGGLRRRFEWALSENVRADYHLLYGGSDERKFRDQQHVELGGDGSDGYRHQTGDVHFHLGCGHNQREPDSDDHLHVDRNQFDWINHIDGDRYGNHVEQTGDQFLHGESHKHHVRFEQHTELDDDRSHQPCYHAGEFYFHFRQWIDERESDRDDDLHTDGDQ
jgi:hypothetical protein